MKTLPPVAATICILLTAPATVAMPTNFYTEPQTILASADAIPKAHPAETPAYDLAEIAASDPALSLRKGQGDEPDAMVMLSDVLFSFGDATLAPEAIKTLSGVAQKLEGVQTLQITGHTDSIGKHSINERLGLQRAASVRDWLVGSGLISETEVTIHSAGETLPIAPNVTADGADNFDGRAQNRRVEFTIMDETQDTAALAVRHPTIF